MSSPSPPSGHSGIGRRRLLALLGCAVIAAPALAACQPLYGTTPSGAAMKDVMASVEIATIPGRVGQRLRNELIFATTRGGSAHEPKYRLEIAVRESVERLLVETTGDARAEMFQLDAKFKLIDLSTDEIVMEGESAGRAGYDRFEPIFSNIRARRDAENRAASSVAEGIRTRIAAYLSANA